MTEDTYGVLVYTMVAPGAIHPSLPRHHKVRAGRAKALLTDTRYYRRTLFIPLSCVKNGSDKLTLPLERRRRAPSALF